MDIMALLAKISAKQRLTIMGAIGALFIGLNQYPNPPLAAPGPEEKQEAAAVAEAILPNGYNPSVIVRDPFAAPARFQQPATSVPAGIVRERPVERIRAALPVLQGIVSAGSVKSAILSLGSESRSYRINEYVGSYMITAIGNNSVTLQGPEGTVVVPMGR